MKPLTKTFEIEYDKKIGGIGYIIVRAKNENQAIGNSKKLVFTGSNFRNAKVIESSKYTKPRKQGFQGSERTN